MGLEPCSAAEMNPLQIWDLGVEENCADPNFVPVGPGGTVTLGKPRGHGDRHGDAAAAGAPAASLPVSRLPLRVTVSSLPASQVAAQVEVQSCAAGDLARVS